MHTNAPETNASRPECLLLSAGTSRGLINKSCLSRGWNLKRLHSTPASHCFVADCSVSASVGTM